MPTPRQIKQVQDFDNNEYFVVHEVVDLPDTDDEALITDHDEEARRRIPLSTDLNIEIAAPTAADSDSEDEFEPQNPQEREWKAKYDAARRQEMIDRCNNKSRNNNNTDSCKNNSSNQVDNSDDDSSDE